MIGYLKKLQDTINKEVMRPVIAFTMIMLSLGYIVVVSMVFPIVNEVMNSVLYVAPILTPDGVKISTYYMWALPTVPSAIVLTSTMAQPIVWVFQRTREKIVGADKNA